MPDKLKKTLIGAVIAVALAAAVSYGLISQQTADQIQNQANQTLGDQTTPGQQNPNAANPNAQNPGTQNPGTPTPPAQDGAAPQTPPAAPRP